MYLSSSNLLEKEESINTNLHIPFLLNFDFNKSTPLLSPDNSFAIFYNDSVILNVDLKTKKIKWYQTFENNEKISNVQINSNNQISFIKQLDTHNEIIILSNSNYMDYNELKLKENILSYKLFQTTYSNDEILLIVNDYFQISLYKDNILQKSISKNIISDVQNGQINYNNKILNIEYLPEQKLILIFFDNGLIIIYSISNFNPENIYSNEEILEYEKCINLNKGEDNQYSYYNLKIHKNNYICDNVNHNNIGEMDIDINNNDKINSKNNYVTTFLTICVNQRSMNKRKSSIYFYKIENGNFISLKDNKYSNDIENKITFDNKEIVDSIIFKYKINNNENDVNDYIFVLFKKMDILNNNKFLYSTEYSNLFHWFNLDKEINNNNNFEIFKIFEEYPNSHIYINNINLSQKNRKIFTINYCKLGEHIISFEHNNENVNNNNLNELLNSSNYNDYLTQLNSINFNENQFNDNICNKYKELYDIKLDEELFKINNGYDNFSKDDISKINYFLLNLISNQSLFKIKNYLLKRNALNSGFIFPIEQICLTCKFLLRCIKNKITNDNKRNNDIEKLLIILINILKILQNRNRTYNDKLFGGEKEIMIEQESIINSLIFDCECILFIYKIQNLFYDLLQKKNLDINEINEKYPNVFMNIFAFDNDNSNINLDKNIYEKIYYIINNLHLIYFKLFPEKSLINLFNPKADNPITLNALLYYIKFIIFNYYFYYVYPKVMNINNFSQKDLCQNEYFKKILSEFKKYFEISKTLYILDNTNDNNPNVSFVDLIKFLQFISNEKLIMNKEINNIIPINKIIYKLINSLRENKYYYEALTIGNALLPFLSSFDEYNSYLNVILELKDYPLAYSFINNCLLLYYKSEEQENKIKKFLQSNVYYEIKKMYFIFYEYLIKNKAIDVLFKLPLNYIEIYIFKELCEENEIYKEFLIIYYIIIGNINEAKYYFQKYMNLNGDNESQSKILTANLIKYYETLINKKSKNEKIDEIIDKISTENKFLLKIDDKEEGRNRGVIRNGMLKDGTGFSESLMKSSIMENKIISGTNYNIEDYNKMSTNLINKLSCSFNKNLSSNFLSKESLKKKIKMNEIKPFSNAQISSIYYTNSNSLDNFISNK